MQYIVSPEEASAYAARLRRGVLSDEPMAIAATARIMKRVHDDGMNQVASLKLDLADLFATVKTQSVDSVT